MRVFWFKVYRSVQVTSLCYIINNCAGEGSHGQSKESHHMNLNLPQGL